MVPLREQGLLLHVGGGRAEGGRAAAHAAQHHPFLDAAAAGAAAGRVGRFAVAPGKGNCFKMM